jgi:hypothetical protein
MPLHPQYHDGDASVIEGFKAYDKWVDSLKPLADGSIMDPVTGDEIVKAD